MLATALTAPTQRNATPERAAARRGSPPSMPCFTSGTSTQGAIAIGQISLETSPMAEMMRGDRA